MHRHVIVDGNQYTITQHRVRTFTEALILMLQDRPPSLAQPEDAEAIMWWAQVECAASVLDDMIQDVKVYEETQKP